MTRTTAIALGHYEHGVIAAALMEYAAAHDGAVPTRLLAAFPPHAATTIVTHHDDD